MKTEPTKLFAHIFSVEDACTWRVETKERIMNRMETPDLRKRAKLFCETAGRGALQVVGHDIVVCIDDGEEGYETRIRTAYGGDEDGQPE